MNLLLYFIHFLYNYNMYIILVVANKAFILISILYYSDQLCQPL
jgi:hypothetical protein